MESNISKIIIELGRKIPCMISLYASASHSYVWIFYHTWYTNALAVDHTHILSDEWENVSLDTTFHIEDKERNYNVLY